MTSVPTVTGTQTPGYRLQVGETSNYGYVDATGAWQTSSGITFKENIATLDSGLSTVLSMRGVEYNVIGENPVEDKQVGFIAQEVEEVIPEIVSTGADGLKGIAYAKLTPVLVETIKELKAENDGLKAENQTMKTAIENLQNDLEAIKKLLQEFQQSTK